MAGGKELAKSLALVPFRSRRRRRQPKTPRAAKPPRGKPETLPKYTDEIVLSYCPAATLTRCAGVCRRWLKLSNHEEFWARLLLQRWGVKVSAFETRPRAKALYRFNSEHYGRLRRLYCLGEPSHLTFRDTGVRAVY